MAGYRGAFLMLLAGVTYFTVCVCGSHCYERRLSYAYAYRYYYGYRYRYSYYYYEYYAYCTYGCCGYETSRSCCSPYYNGNNDNDSAKFGVIAGSTIGGICFVGIIYSIIICCICNCKDKNRVGGIVVDPATNGTNNIGMSDLTAPVQTGPSFNQHNKPPLSANPDPPNVA